jgi:hypothetical protein
LGGGKMSGIGLEVVTKHQKSSFALEGPHRGKTAMSHTWYPLWVGQFSSVFIFGEWQTPPRVHTTQVSTYNKEMKPGKLRPQQKTDMKISFFCF